MDTGGLPKHAVTKDGGMKAVTRLSPNFGDRAGTERPSFVVLHYTGMATFDDAIERLCSPESMVSAHYLVNEAGRVTQLVDESKRAWHAGSGEWARCNDINSHSIGIEIANPGDRPYSEDQMSSVEALLEDIMSTWQIPASGVIGHSDMAPDRKFDPGPKFDWRRLALRGLSVWPEFGHGIEPDPHAFASAAAHFGYLELPDPLDQGALQTLLTAFRSRFRSWARGPLDEQDMGAITFLADHHPAA